MADTNKGIKRLGWLALVPLLLLAGASVAVAQETELGGKIQAGDQVVVAEGETIDGDLYASGGEVRIEGTVEGDLVAAAGRVTISGEVGGDLMASGGFVDISGDVIGDARVAAGQSTLSGSVGEDLFIASGQATVSSSGTVGEDLVFGSGQMNVDGTVEGNVLGATGNYNRGGTVGGTEDVTVRQIDEEDPTAGDRILDAVQRLISLILVAALVYWLARRLVEAPARTVRERPLASFGIGLAGIIGFGILIFLVFLVGVLLAIGLALAGLGDLVGAVVFATLLGVALLVFLFFLATVFGAPAWVGLALAGLAMPSESTGRRWAALIIGLVVLVALSAIPVVGGWIGFIVVVFGLGAVILAYWPRRRIAAPMEPAGSSP